MNLLAWGRDIHAKMGRWEAGWWVSMGPKSSEVRVFLTGYVYG